MTDLITKLESLLFVAGKPLTVRRMAEITGDKPEAIENTLKELAEKWNHDTSGIQLLRHGSTIQLVSSPLVSKMITEYLKEEQAGELTRPALEALTIIAYRGPISKIQLDTIRGVNCALILRNLMIKGLVESTPQKDRLQTSYEVTADFLRFLGLKHISELPDYEKLHTEETLELLLNPSVITTNENVTETAANETIE